MSVFDLCNTKETRFLYDLLEAAAHDRHDHPVPELHAITRAVERMWGGHHKKLLPVSAGLLYYLAVYESHPPHTPEEVEERREGIGFQIGIEQFWSLRNETMCPKRRHTSMKTSKRLILKQYSPIYLAFS